MEYNEISRRGLIRLNSDYDQANEGKLKEFLDGKGESSYEPVKKYETVFESLHESIEVAKEAGDAVSKMAVERAEKILGNITDSVLQEVDRFREVFDEHRDDQSYPDSDN